MLSLPQLILLDFHPVGQNGAQTMACLRQFPRWQFVPVIVLSSTTNQRETEICYEAGATAVVSKVASWQQLSQTIQATLATWAIYKDKNRVTASHQ